MNITANCPVCKGEGLIGAGDMPWLRQGPISTCGNCGGSGKVEDIAPEVVAEAPTEPTPEPEAPTEETQTPSNSDDTTTTDSSSDSADVAPVIEETVDSANTDSEVSSDTLESAE